MSLEQLPVALLLAVSMAVGLGGGIIKNYFCINISNGSADRQAYNGVTSLAAAIVLLVWGGISSVSVFTVGILYNQQIYFYPARTVLVIPYRL